MKRRQFLKTTSATCALAIVTPVASAATASANKTFEPPRAFELDEMTMQQLQQGMQSGKFSSRSLVEKYSDRIN